MPAIQKPLLLELLEYKKSTKLFSYLLLNPLQLYLKPKPYIQQKIVVGFFNSILVVMVFSDLALPVFVFCILVSSVYLYLLLNVRTNTPISSRTRKLVKTGGFKNTPNELVLKLNLLTGAYALVYLWVYRTHNSLMWFNHLQVTNLTLGLMVWFNLIIVLIFLLLLNKIFSVRKIPFEYFFAILSLNTILPLLLITTNVFTFFFFTWSVF